MPWSGNIDSISQSTPRNYMYGPFVFLLDEISQSTCFALIGDLTNYVMTEDKTFSIDVTVTDVKYIKYNELTEEELTKKVHNLMENAKICEKLIYESKRVNKIHKDF